MRLNQHSRLLGVILFLLLAVSYLWCIVDNIVSSADMTNVGGWAEVTAVVLFSAIVWLIGHGIHGAAFIVLPILLWSRRSAEAQTTA